MSAAALIRLHRESESAAFWIGGVLDRGYQNWVCREITDSFLVCERDCVARREESAWGSISLCHGFSGYLLFGWIIVACYYHQGIEC